MDGASVRRTAQRLGIHRNTALRWRHKLLRAAGTVDRARLSGTVEIDETYVRTCHKGARDIQTAAGRPARKRGYPAAFRGLSRHQKAVVVARDRAKNTVVLVASDGPPRTTRIVDLLGSVIARGSVLWTDGFAPYRGLARNLDLDHKVVPREQHVLTKLHHVQNVNAFHRRFKDWMKRFHGVRHTHLQLYADYFVLVDRAALLTTTAAQGQILTEACAARPLALAA